MKNQRSETINTIERVINNEIEISNLTLYLNQLKQLIANARYLSDKAFENQDYQEQKNQYSEMKNFVLIYEEKEKELNSLRKSQIILKQSSISIMETFDELQLKEIFDYIINKVLKIETEKQKEEKDRYSLEVYKHFQQHLNYLILEKKKPAIKAKIKINSVNINFLQTEQTK